MRKQKNENKAGKLKVIPLGGHLQSLAPKQFFKVFLIHMHILSLFFQFHVHIIQEL